MALYCSRLFSVFVVVVALKLFIGLLILELGGSHYITQAGLEFLGSYNHPVSVSWCS